MKILLDTNIFIPLEPTSLDDIEYSTDQVMELQRIANEDKHEVYLHPSSLEDIRRDKNSQRMQLRVLEFSKYSKLEATDPSTSFLEIVSSEKKSTNDEVDNTLLYSVYNNAVNIFVTEDRGIHSKARLLGIEERVYLASDALLLLKKLRSKEIIPPPAVKKIKCYNIDVKDPIFDSLRKDYDGFDKWFAECQKKHRECFIIKGYESINGICILKDECDKYGIDGSILKLCTFKVAPHAKGVKYGELLLKAVFDFLYNGDYEGVYLTAYPKHLSLKFFFQNFGFRVIDTKETSEELIIARKLNPNEVDFNNFKPLEFHTLFGPKFIHTSADSYIIPIQPRYSSVLFPELEQQADLFEGCNSFGNSILKAYLSHSRIKNILPGSTIYFYRSKDIQGIQAIGVVEKILRSNNPDEIASFVGKRTVYSGDTIKEMCNKEVLAVLFRQANSFEEPIFLDLLKNNKVFIKPPQSIMSVKTEGAKWLAQQKRM